MKRTLTLALPRNTYTVLSRMEFCPVCNRKLIIYRHDISERLEIGSHSELIVIEIIHQEKICSHCGRIFNECRRTPNNAVHEIGSRLLAHTITAVFAEHVPYYRMSELYARQGVILSPAELSSWSVSVSELLKPLYKSLQVYVQNFMDISTQNSVIGFIQKYEQNGNNLHIQAPMKCCGLNENEQLFKQCLTAYYRLMQVKNFSDVAGITQAYQRIVEIESASNPGLSDKMLEYIKDILSADSRVLTAPESKRLSMRAGSVMLTIRSLHNWMQQTSLTGYSDISAVKNHLQKEWLSLYITSYNNNIEAYHMAINNLLQIPDLEAVNDEHLQHTTALQDFMVVCRLSRVEPERWLRYALQRISGCTKNNLSSLYPWNM